MNHNDNQLMISKYSHKRDLVNLLITIKFKPNIQVQYLQ